MEVLVGLLNEESVCLSHVAGTVRRRMWRVQSRPSTAPGLGVCEWSPEGYDKSVSWIPTTDEILKLVKKKIN